MAIPLSAEYRCCPRGHNGRRERTGGRREMPASHGGEEEEAEEEERRRRRGKKKKKRSESQTCNIERRAGPGQAGRSEGAAGRRIKRRRMLP